MVAPRWPKRAPRCPQEGPRSSQDPRAALPALGPPGGGLAAPPPRMRGIGAADSPISGGGPWSSGPLLSGERAGHKRHRARR